MLVPLMNAIPMPRLTPPRARLTTRNYARGWSAIGLGGLLLVFTGCATPGPNHAYVASRAQNPVLDLRVGSPALAVPTFLSPANTLYGIAYDPFTDHLFLRIFPGNFIRVIDRPAGKIKRSFTVEGLPAGSGDLAIRSSDRHLFFAHPVLPAVVESTLYGRFVRTLALTDLPQPPAGVAYDQRRDELLILSSGELAEVVTYDLAGKRLNAVTLDRKVSRRSLAYDSVADEFYCRLSEEAALGVFNRQGHWQRSIPLPPADERGEFIDVGARSLLRLF